MRSLGGEERLDEVHCLWALCPHPCCWEAERRISEGVYRRAIRATTKHSANAEESLPSLTVVDVSEWAGTRTASSYRTDLSTIPSRCVRPWKETTPRFKISPFPQITSAAAKSLTGESGNRNKGVNAFHISPLIDMPWGPESLVLWVSNPHYIPQRHKSSKAPRCSVNELVCLPAAQTEDTPKSTRKGTTKTVRFQLTCSPLTVCPSQKVEPGTPGQLEVGTGGASAAVDESESDVLREPSAFLMKNRPVVYHSLRDKRVSRASQDQAASLYKLDSKTGVEDVDWGSLRGQTYLWKRHNVHPELLGPPGGARGAQVSVSSSPVFKVSSDRMLHSPQCTAPAAQRCVKRPLRSGRYTYPQLSHRRGTDSELDMTICSSSAVTNHRMLDTHESRERDEGSKGVVVPVNSGFYEQRSNHKLYAETHGGVKGHERTLMAVLTPAQV
ncbi:uncharacterized protein DAT39_020191 [Clarias magur]|uniref:Uncharacterized protein n=1 Tax=Clarias magur TaxID=1594786 RepID=A0A8J4U3D3_CLAMG|nr:uncharacterized protein DAT39_020191 [Clarias magur]